MAALSLLYLQNVRQSPYKCLYGAIMEVINDPEHNLNLSVTATISASFSTTIGIDAKFVSACVGFSVTGSISGTWGFLSGFHGL